MVNYPHFHLRLFKVRKNNDLLGRILQAGGWLSFTSVIAAAEQCDI
jgi:hypothetical protein